MLHVASHKAPLLFECSAERRFARVMLCFRLISLLCLKVDVERLPGSH